MLWHRGADGVSRCCAASARRPRASETPEQQRLQKPSTTSHPDRKTGRQRSPTTCWSRRCIMHWLFPVISVLAALPVHARPRSAGRRFRRRHRHVDRLHPAVHGRRHALGRGPAAHPTRALDGARPSLAAATGIGSWLFGYPFLTSHSRYAYPAAGRQGAAGHRDPVRSRRLLAGAGRHRADPDRAGPPVDRAAAGAGRSAAARAAAKETA